MDFIADVSKKCAVSLGHTSCTYEQAVEAFARAATGEIPFTDFSPVHLATYEEEIAPRENVKLPIRG